MPTQSSSPAGPPAPAAVPSKPPEPEAGAGERRLLHRGLSRRPDRAWPPGAARRRLARGAHRLRRAGARVSPRAARLAPHPLHAPVRLGGRRGARARVQLVHAGARLPAAARPLELPSLPRVRAGRAPGRRGDRGLAGDALLALAVGSRGCILSRIRVHAGDASGGGAGGAGAEPVVQAEPTQVEQSSLEQTCATSTGLRLTPRRLIGVRFHPDEASPPEFPAAPNWTTLLTIN